MKYEIHPLAEALPAMSESEYRELLADVRTRGHLLDAITLYEGKVLDGRHRLRACEEAGIEPKFEEYTGSDPVGYVLAKNIQRRHLTPSQKAIALLNLRQVVSKLGTQAEQRRRNNLKKGQAVPDTVT
jgi:ParB-like chromosome segregation protein Spo0J